MLTAIAYRIMFVAPPLEANLYARALTVQVPKFFPQGLACGFGKSVKTRGNTGTCRIRMVPVGVYGFLDAWGFRGLDGETGTGEPEIRNIRDTLMNFTQFTDKPKCSRFIRV